MRRGTTPTITMTLPKEISVSGLKAATLSIAQGGEEIISKNLSALTPDATLNTLAVTLTQEETLKLGNDIAAEIQLKEIPTTA